MSGTYSKAEKRAMATAARTARSLAKAVGGSARKRAMFMVEHTARLNMGERTWLDPAEVHYLRESFKTPEERILYKKLMNTEEAQRIQLLGARAALSELMEFVEGYVRYWSIKKNMEAMAVNLNNLLDIFTTPKLSKLDELQNKLDKLRASKIKGKFLDMFKPGAKEQLLEEFRQTIIKQTVTALKQEAIRKIIEEFKGPYIKFKGGLGPREYVAVAPTGGPLDIDKNIETIKEELYRAQAKLKTLIKVNRDLMAAHKVQIKPYIRLIDQIDKYAGAIKHLREINIRSWEDVEINQALYNQLAENISTWKPVTGRGR